MDQQAEKDKTERVTGLGRRTREEIAKCNQMTALRFQTGGRRQTSPASLRGQVRGVTKECKARTSWYHKPFHPFINTRFLKSI